MVVRIPAWKDPDPFPLPRCSQARSSSHPPTRFHFYRSSPLFVSHYPLLCHHKSFPVHEAMQAARQTTIPSPQVTKNTETETVQPDFLRQQLRDSPQLLLCFELNNPSARLLLRRDRLRTLTRVTSPLGSTLKSGACHCLLFSTVGSRR